MLVVRAALPILLPKAIRWGESTARDVAASGFPLNAAALEDARAVGVREPERIRVSVVDEIPTPDDLLLAGAAASLGFLSENTAGLSLGHSILVRRGRLSRSLLSHECRHTAQCEAAGSLSAFLDAYLRELVEVGYDACSYEVDARNHELPNADLRWRPF